jgi:hypothetical protein
MLTALAAMLAVEAFVVVIPAAQAWHRHKPHCHTGDIPKHVRIHVRGGRRHVWIRVWTCVRKSTRAPSGGPLASMGAEPAPSLFGIDTSTYDSSHTDFVNDFPTARGLGSRWDRFTLGPQNATGDYAMVDYEVRQVRQLGMGAILSFGGIQSACSLGTSDVAGCPPTTATDLSNYQNYVEQILAHYHNVVDYYESWTEPNHGSRWGGRANPAQYAALLKAQYQAFQAFNSQHPGSGPGGGDMKLLFGSANGFTITQPAMQQPDSSGDMAALPFIHQVLDDLGGTTAFDGVALHAYRYPPSNGPNDPEQDYVGTLAYPGQRCHPAPDDSCEMTWSQELSAYEQEFTNHGYGQPPMWLTEFGWPGGEDPTSSYCQSNAGYCPTPEMQDSDLNAAYRTLLGLPFVEGALWFNLRDYQPNLSTPDPPFFYHYGLLSYDYGHKPAADDFEALAAANPNR